MVCDEVADDGDEVGKSNGTGDKEQDCGGMRVPSWDSGPANGWDHRWAQISAGAHSMGVWEPTVKSAGTSQAGCQTQL